MSSHGTTAIRIVVALVAATLFIALLYAIDPVRRHHDYSASRSYLPLSAPRVQWRDR